MPADIDASATAELAEQEGNCSMLPRAAMTYEELVSEQEGNCSMLPRAAMTYEELVSQYSQAIAAASCDAMSHPLVSKKVLTYTLLSLPAALQVYYVMSGLHPLLEHKRFERSSRFAAGKLPSGRQCMSNLVDLSSMFTRPASSLFNKLVSLRKLRQINYFSGTS